MAMDEFEENWTSKIRSAWLPVTIFVVVAGAIAYFLHDTGGIRREAPPLPTLIATLPPPPPPPPPQKQPEMEKKVEDVQKPVEQQQKVTDAPKPVTINGPAQAGNDAFNVGAGSGGGEIGSGSGFGDENYGRFMSSTIQQAVQSNERTSSFVGTAEVDVWIDAEGHVTRASIARTSGDPMTDQDLVAVLQGMPTLEEPPPSSLRFPQRIRIGGKRRGTG